MIYNLFVKASVDRDVNVAFMPMPRAVVPLTLPGATRLYSFSGDSPAQNRGVTFLQACTVFLAFVCERQRRWQ
jgi:hypothetical protein